MIVAVIPARGGSKRIPGKNIKPFAGQPIIAYSIQAALEAGCFDRVIVSTDSEEIADVARHYGAEVPFLRPADLADDFSGTDAVMLHAISWLERDSGKVDYICCIYPTAPFVTSANISKGYELLCREKAFSAFSVATFEYPIFRALKVNENDKLEMLWPDCFNTRSQDLEEAYHDAGQFYWADVEHYKVEQRFFGADAVPVLIPRYLVQDIDTIEDWERAEMMCRIIKEGKTDEDL